MNLVHVTDLAAVVVAAGFAGRFYCTLVDLHHFLR